MNVCELRDRLVADYSDFTRSFLQIHDGRIRSLVDAELDSGLLWPELLIQLNPTFEPGGTVDEFVDEGLLPRCRAISAELTGVDEGACAEGAAATRVGRDSADTRGRRPGRRDKRPESAPALPFPTRPAEPQVGYPEAAPAHRRAAETAARAPASSGSPSQGTLADLTRAAAASGDWLPEEAVDAASIVPGRHVRHRRFGKGVVIEVRRTVKPPSVTIRFGASDDREIAIGYGLIEFKAD